MRLEDYLQACSGLKTPFAWLDKALFCANAVDLLRRSGGKPIRLATKSIRCAPALRFLLDRYPGFQGLLCYHPLEAAWLYAKGFDDLVVAYPSVDKAGLHAVTAAVQKGARIALMTDHPDHLRAIHQAAKEAGVVQPVWLELDCSVSFPGLWFGVYRSPVRGLGDLDAYLETLASCTNLRLEGVMGYEAQIAGVADNAPGQAVKNALIRLLKNRSVPRIREWRKVALEKLRDSGYHSLQVNGGGTGSLESTGSEPWVTELAAGSGLYGPALFDGYRQFKPKPSLGFALEVCRIPGPGMATCLGGGYIASGAVGSEKQPVPYLPEGMSLFPMEMAGEVQTPLRTGPHNLKIGDRVFFRHAKAGELCEHFNELAVLEGGQLTDSWITYRGEQQSFLG